MKRKRPKLLHQLLNTNWSKLNQQANNLAKLNRILLVSDVNFIDEKSGQSPLSLVVCSPLINSTASNLLTPNAQASALSSPSLGAHRTPLSPLSSCSNQPGSLFSLKCQSSGLSYSRLMATSVTEIVNSKTSLVERIIQIMVKAGAQVDFQDSDGRVPLHMAAIKSNFWALKTLLDLGASPDLCDSTGLTPLYYSILHRADLKVTQLLLSHQNNTTQGSATSNTNNQHDHYNHHNYHGIGIRDQHGWQEVHQACKLGLDSHLEKLLYYGCDIGAKIAGSGNTPLHVAAINDQINCAKVLLMRGADKTITNSSHQTAHQVAVISGNMDLAEFIAEHTSSQVIPFKDHPSDFIRGSGSSYNATQTNHQKSPVDVTLEHQPDHQEQLARQLSIRSALVSSQSSFQLRNHNSSSQRFTDANRMMRLQQKTPQTTMSPLSLELMNNDTLDSFPTLRSNSSRGSLGRGPSSLVPHSLEPGELSNVSPCLSQRSFATSNTTSSSGVCLDGDGSNSANEDSQLPINANGSLNIRLNNSVSQHSNVTVISIGSRGPPSLMNSNSNMSSLSQIDHDEIKSTVSEESDTSTDSNCTGLYSLMLEERPLVSGNLVEAMSDYQSGDPTHLQLHRGDIIEILDCSPELLFEGRMPRLANKPMLYGRIVSNGDDKERVGGLFPSFCVRRTRSHNHNGSKTGKQRHSTGCQQSGLIMKQNCIRQSNPITESQSMIALENQNLQLHGESSSSTGFDEFQVKLTKVNDGFGFVLRGAKIDPGMLNMNGDCGAMYQPGNTSTLPLSLMKGGNQISINERLMEKNNLASLQYLDEIEPNSVADRSGLRRGDFLIAVNNNDVRLKSHEQVVRMIRESGNQVCLTIAAPRAPTKVLPVVPTYATSKTVVKIKPEPPKRDPNTTLSRNKSIKQKVCPPIENEESQSMASTLSPQNTPTHSSSSASVMTTVAANPNAPGPLFEEPQEKPDTYPKPQNVYQSEQQAIYQPAVITTSARKKQSNGPNNETILATAQPTSSIPPPKVSSFPVANASMPPPPPPPLPDFSQSPTRPISSNPVSLVKNHKPPIPQSTKSQTDLGLGLDAERLRQKRASLASVNVATRRSSANTGPVCPEIGSVAAACAAAANDRMQRQQNQKSQSAASQLDQAGRKPIHGQVEAKVIIGQSAHEIDQQLQLQYQQQLRMQQDLRLHHQQQLQMQKHQHQQQQQQQIEIQKHQQLLAQSLPAHMRQQHARPLRQHQPQNHQHHAHHPHNHDVIHNSHHHHHHHHQHNHVQQSIYNLRTCICGKTIKDPF